MAEKTKGKGEKDVILELIKSQFYLLQKIVLCKNGKL